MEILQKNTLAEGKWLSFETIDYLDPNGKKRSWETVSRKNCPGAVLMIAELLPSHRLILIRQYRPPAGSMVLEFPAGLIDPGESPESAALRELREETGFKGTIRRILPRSYNSPGLTGEFIYPVLMEIQENEQARTETDFDDSEFIETLLIPKNELLDLIEKENANGTAIDAKVIAYALGQQA